ncbi:hypothetical protein [Wolbachia endosymbiont (group A) of Gymnosoma rotundatum]|uniref:hypothetical protein n=1 Tax=Wolbachia endosymbiont (group A) of Gymnosoma rotundatum TaxID=2954016 RepID=UPI002226A322|nr:hypothetical protein [Wolbachia endosymbiont (group A) of Gymnosoma rotundatum]
MTRLIFMPPRTVIPRFIRGISRSRWDDGCRLATNIKKFTKQKKGKRSPVVG